MFFEVMNNKGNLIKIWQNLVKGYDLLLHHKSGACDGLINNEALANLYFFDEE